MKKIVFFITTFCLFCKLYPEWTWCYKKKFVTQQLTDGQNAFIKKETPLFNQLIFSWNALMPYYGPLTFFVRIRYADTAQWSEWHKMAEWSEKGSKTFYGKHVDGLEYSHVRLELPKHRLADSFHIKVVAEHRMAEQDVKMLAVCISRLEHFQEESIDGAIGSSYIHNVPGWSQMLLPHPKCKVICSPTALCGLVSYINGKEEDPLVFAEGVYDRGLGVYGSWPCNTAYAFCAANAQYFFHVQRLHSVTALLNYVQRGIPVVVSVRGSLPNAPKPYPSGHLLLVIGYDAKNRHMICIDSAVSSGSLIKKYPIDAFLKAWEASHRLSYIVSDIS